MQLRGFSEPNRQMCHAICVMAEPKLIVVRFQNKVPAMVSCAKCQRNFFTLSYAVMKSLYSRWLANDDEACSAPVEVAQIQDRLFS